jgi:hypothetical protein
LGDFQLGSELGKGSSGDVKETDGISVAAPGFSLGQIRRDADGGPGDLIAKKPFRSQRRSLTETTNGNGQSFAFLPNSQRAIAFGHVAGSFPPQIHPEELPNRDGQAVPPIPNDTNDWKRASGIGHRASGIRNLASGLGRLASGT